MLTLKELTEKCCFRFKAHCRGIGVDSEVTIVINATTQSELELLCSKVPSGRIKPSMLSLRKVCHPFLWDSQNGLVLLEVSDIPRILDPQRFWVPWYYCKVV